MLTLTLQSLFFSFSLLLSFAFFLAFSSFCALFPSFQGFKDSAEREILVIFRGMLAVFFGAQKQGLEGQGRARCRCSEIPSVLLGIPWPALRGPLRSHFPDLPLLAFWILFFFRAFPRIKESFETMFARKSPHELVGACLATDDRIFATRSDGVSKGVLRSCGCFCLRSGHTIMVWKRPRSPQKHIARIVVLRSSLSPLSLLLGRDPLAN